MDRCTGRPPPHLKGSLMVQFVKGKGNHNWKTKYLVVLKETLSIFESDQKRKQGKQEFISIKLTEANITNIIAEKVPRGCSVNWAFSITFKDQEVHFLASSSDEFKFWFEGIQYVKKFWNKQISIEMSNKLKESTRDGSNTQRANFTTSVTDVHGFAHSLALPYDAKFNDVYRAIYRPQGNNSSRGSLRMLREQGAQIWRVDEAGSDFMIPKLEEIYPHVENGCQLFLLEQGYKILVIFCHNESFTAIPVQPNITVAQVIEVPTVSEFFQNLGYEKAKLVRLVENDTEIPLRDTDRPVEVFYDLADSGIWRRKTDVRDKLLLKEKPCIQLEDVACDDETIALNRGIPFAKMDAPDLPPVYRTPSLRGKSPIKEMFEGLTKLRSNETTGSLGNGTKHSNSLKVNTNDWEHRVIAEEESKYEQYRTVGVDKRMGPNWKEGQKLGERAASSETLQYVSTDMKGTASENHGVQLEESEERKPYHGFAEPSLNKEEDTQPGSQNMSENSRNSALSADIDNRGLQSESRSVNVDEEMSGARTGDETGGGSAREFENTEVNDEKGKGMKHDFQEVDNHMISRAEKEIESCTTVNTTHPAISNERERCLDSSLSGEQAFKEELAGRKQDTKRIEHELRGITQVINKPNSSLNEAENPTQLVDSVIEDRYHSVRRTDYSSSQTAEISCSELQYLGKDSENKLRNIEISEDKAQKDLCPVKVNVEIYYPDNIPIVGESMAMILPTSDNASTLTTLQTKSCHDSEISDDDDDDASSVSSIESFMNKKDGSLPESEEKTGQPNDTTVLDRSLRNADSESERHQPGVETKSDAIIVDAKGKDIGDESEKDNPSIETKANANGLDREPKVDAVGCSPLNSSRATSSEPSQQNKMQMGDVQQSKENEACARNDDIKSKGSIVYTGGSVKQNRRRNAFKESASIKEVRMETVRRLSNERLERERQQRKNEGQHDDSAAMGYANKTKQAIETMQDAAEETQAVKRQEKMHTESSTLEQGTSCNNETGLSIAGASSLLGERATGTSSPIATTSTSTAAATAAAATTTTLSVKTAAAATKTTVTNDAIEHLDHEVNPGVLPLRVPCSTCEGLKTRPWQVVKYKEMGIVLKQCTKTGKETNAENKYDRICLSGVHLRIKEGEWELTDGTICHSKSELTDSLEEMKSTANQQDRNSIASKIVKEKHVNLKGGICCYWIPRRATGTWRVTRYTEENLNVEQPRNDDEENWKIRAIPSPSFNESNEEVTNNGEPAEEENVPASDTVQAAKALPGQSVFNEAKETLSRKLSTAMKGILPHIPSAAQRPSSPSQVYMSLEMIEVRERLIVPLYRAVNQIRKHFINAPPECLAHQVGDDSVNPSIGWLVRREFCSALSALLLAGMKSDSAILKFVVSRTNQLNLFSLVKNVCRSCVEEPVLDIVVKVIEESPFLFDDSLRFRNFVCEALNWQNEAYTEKLLVTWFKTFVMLKHVIEKFYKKGSLWKLQGAEQAGLIEEVIVILENLNGYRFTLHADFEHKELAKRMEEEQMAFMLQRDPPDVDMEVMVFE